MAFVGVNSAEVVQSLIGADVALGYPGPGLRAGINLLARRWERPVRVEQPRRLCQRFGERAHRGFRGTGHGRRQRAVGSLELTTDLPPASPLEKPISFISGNLIRHSAGYGLDLLGQSDITISNNTVRNNGTGGANPAGIRLTNAANDTSRTNVLVRNIVTGNLGPGILITGNPVDSNRGNTITLNSIFQNGGIGIDLGGTTSNPLTGDGMTLNDPNDTDDGGNALDNFPVIETATISGNSLIVSGWARNRATMEFFVDPPASQGRTFIGTAGEDTPEDSDSGFGAYGPGPINGISQGADLTERFQFTFPLP